MTSPGHLLMADLGAGYRRAPGSLIGFRPTSNWCVIQEKLFDETKSSLILLRKGNAVFGTVLAVGPEARSEGITPGDLVCYEEWEGGRWGFPDENVSGGVINTLVMRSEHLLFRIPAEDAPKTSIN